MVHILPCGVGTPQIVCHLYVHQSLFIDHEGWHDQFDFTLMDENAKSNNPPLPVPPFRQVKPRRGVNQQMKHGSHGIRALRMASKHLRRTDTTATATATATGQRREPWLLLRYSPLHLDLQEV
ncbi:hypothetical protein AB0M90_12185 [Micrococcus luteus]|uniref:hypothetical protein n=1 Tax=Micrococcus luteus TaxID=1270 RepID=UPI0021CC84A1|nr:hypothetical protein [Micrococcus luteus]